MTFRKAVLCALSFAAISALPVEAKQTLTIASWAPPTHVINSEVWPEFIRRLETVSDGALTATVKLGLAPPPGMADLVLDGAADITYIFHGYNPGRFVTSELVELPGTMGGAEATSTAYWRVWNEMLKAAGEQDEFKTAAMFMHGAAQFHLVRPVASITEIGGMKLRAPGGVGSMVIEGLGAVGIQVPATKVYETLSSGAADGVVMNLDSRTGFRMNEVAPAMFEVPGGLYRGSFTVLMNREVWDSLDPQLRQKLDDELFGEPLSRLFGRHWDGGDRAALQSATDLGHPRVVASQADLEVFDAVARDVEEQILEKVDGTGVNAARALEMFRAQSERVMQEIGE
ncbi:TRAP transporter substrate-binding protein [Stappia sp.]|uniref:TRAP transporter substrate-binding protein n=1 Tax=Stappia sp. TaxID=1870903 RepID=UPI003C7DA71E